MEPLWIQFAALPPRPSTRSAALSGCWGLRRARSRPG